MKNILQQLFSALALVLLCQSHVIGQQSKYNWKISTSGGIYSYYGDLTDKFRLIQPNPRTIKPIDNINLESYGWSVERSLGAAWSVGLSFNKGVFIANDRAIDWGGNLRTDNKYFARSLNAKTKLKNYNLFFAYYLERRDLMGKKATLVPYAKFGSGLTAFSVYGDLFTNEQRYHYWPDGTIRDAEPGSPNSNIISQDGIFETNLTQLQTEGKKYKTHVFTPSLGLGLKFRISQKLNLNLEYGLFLTQTDYLDDVAGEYPSNYTSELQRYASNPANSTDAARGNPDGKNDLFTFASLSLQYSFNKKPTAFQAPAIYIGPLFFQIADSSNQAEKAIETNHTATKNTPPKKTPIVLSEIDTSIEISNADTNLIVLRIIRKLDSQPVAKDTNIVEIEVEVERVSKDDSTVTIEKKELIIETKKDSILTDTIIMLNTEKTIIDSAGQTERELEEDLLLADSINVEPALDSIQLKDTTVQLPAQPIPDTLARIDSSRANSLIIDSVDLKVKEPKKKVEIQKIEASENPPATDTLRKKTETPVNTKKEEINSDKYTSGLLKEIDELKKEVQAMKASITGLEQVKELVAEDRQTLQRIELQLKELEAFSKSPQNEKMNRELEQLKAEVKTLQDEIGFIAAKNEAKSIEQTEPSQPVNPLADSINTLSANVAAMQARLDSLRSNNFKETDQKIKTDSFEILANRLQTKLDSLLKIQKQKEIEEAEKKAQELKQQEEQKRKKEIKRIQEEAAAKQRKLEEEKRILETALKEKEEKEKEREKYLKLEKISKDFGVKSVYFDKSSDELPAQQREVIASASKLLLVHPELKVQVQGFADPSGPKEANLQLAQKRASTVVESIKHFGISEDRIIFLGGNIDYNAVKPELGRRVEISLVL